MRLTIKDLDTAVELIAARLKDGWDALPWPCGIQSRPRQGGSRSVVLEQAWVEPETNIGIAGQWREDNPQPVSVTLEFSKIPQALPSPPAAALAVPLLQKEAAQPSTTTKEERLRHPREPQVLRQKACEHCGRVFGIDLAGRRFCCKVCGDRAGGKTPVVEHTEDCPQRFSGERREDEPEIRARGIKRVPDIIRRKPNDNNRRQEQGFLFHLLLPGQASPWRAPRTTLEQSPVCPGCRWKFRPDIEEDQFCCDPCANRKRQHDALRCTRVAPLKLRMLREIRGAEALRRRRSPTVNLVACEEDKDGLFLQLALYAARAEQVSSEVEEEAVIRFKKKFRVSVGRLSPSQLQGQDRRKVQDEILLNAWSKVRGELKEVRGELRVTGYQIPDTPDGFSRYARRVISAVKSALRAQNAIPATSAGIESDDEGIDGDDLRKRTGDGSWTNRRVEDRQEAYSLGEAAAHIGMTERTFYALVERGDISARRDGRAYTLLSDWESQADQWKKQEQERLRKSGLRKLFALAWEKHQRLPSPNSLTKKKKLKIINPSAVTQIKRWYAAGMSEDEVKNKIGRADIQRASKEAGAYLTEQEVEAVSSSVLS